MKKYWALTGIITIVLLSFIISDSFWNTLARKRAIRNAEQELERISAEVKEMREKVSRLETDPATYESLVRQELGYMRPGEKEARFIEKTR